MLSTAPSDMLIIDVVREVSVLPHIVPLEYLPS